MEQFVMRQAINDFRSATMLNTSNIPGGGRFRTRFYAMMAPSEKSVFDHWARRIGALHLAVATFLIVVATMNMPSSDKPAGANAVEIKDRATSFDPRCSQREVEVVTFLEDHAASGDIPAAELGEAGLAMMAARYDCYQGHVEQALARYDRILQIGVRLSDTSK
jgi:hypothetical protein